jgi:ABC-type polysaccharide/polyol phosphate transport system ATPase subunit
VEGGSSEPGSPVAGPAGPVVIEARGLEKNFRIPSHRIDSLKERALHPLRRVEYRKLRALAGIDLDVHRGEFFGILGRNGSGKSTLLKVLASIYRADTGRIRMAGRVAPFIELGVGFNPDLSARENVVLNGVMMGLSRREAARRLDAVLDFAELREFVDLKLKNYSSGMQVRLAFAVMIQSDSDILLIDEVLAVGDAAFQRKCTNVFDEMRGSPRTIVLVTHDMGVVQRYCQRAMLLEEGEQVYLGEPETAGREYLRINFERLKESDRAEIGFPDLHTRLVEASIQAENGDPITVLQEGDPIRLTATLEARRELLEPRFRVLCVTEDGSTVFEVERPLDPGRADRLASGEHARISGRIDNPLKPGRYTLKCVVARRREAGDLALQVVNLAGFEVRGTPGTANPIVSVGAELEVTPEAQA